ncbi:MAG: DUF5683 domain-containing protein [Rhodothermales bacterium]
MRALCVLLMGLCALPDLATAQATLSGNRPDDVQRLVIGRALPPAVNRTPQDALRRALLVPGWGQIYNRQYIKLPFVYGALGGLATLAVLSHQDYTLYRDAYQYKAWQELVDAGAQAVNPKAEFQSAYDEIAAEFGTVSSRPIQTQRNNFRRSRDLSLIGIGLVYGLAVLDAYVSAHLIDFDDGTDLSLHVAPVPSGIRTTVLIPLGSR